MARAYEVLHGIPNALADFFPTHEDRSLLVLYQLRFPSCEGSLCTSVLGFAANGVAKALCELHVVEQRGLPAYIVLSIDMAALSSIRDGCELYG